MKIEIQIEKVVVQGAAIGPCDARALTAAIRAGMTQRLASHSICLGVHTSQSIQSIEYRPWSPANGAGTKALGGHIADAIVGGIGGNARGGIGK